MTCRECGAHQEVWGCVALCDRCLDARLYRQLEEDDYLMVRRHPNGDIWVKSKMHGTKRMTNATWLNVDIPSWFEQRFEEFQEVRTQ